MGLSFVLSPTTGCALDSPTGHFFLSVKSSVILFVLEIDRLSKSHRVHLQPR